MSFTPLPPGRIYAGQPVVDHFQLALVDPAGDVLRADQPSRTRHCMIRPSTAHRATMVNGVLQRIGRRARTRTTTRAARSGVSMNGRTGLLASLVSTKPKRRLVIAMPSARTASASDSKYELTAAF